VAKGEAKPHLVRKPSSHALPLTGRPDPRLLLAKLRNDPSLRFNESGRRTLRWLHQHIVHIDSWEGHSLPDHCAPVVADLARTCALAWISVAEQLEQRVRGNPAAVTRKAE
jgi:hypothetical protein